MARGRIKMMGLARTSIMVAFWTAAANFRLIDAFERGEQHDDPDYRYLPRQPRRRRAVPYADRETGRDPPSAPGRLTLPQDPTPGLIAPAPNTCVRGFVAPQGPQAPPSSPALSPLP